MTLRIFAWLNRGTFLLLGVVGLGSLIAWGVFGSYFTFAPFARFIHQCSQMSAIPKFYLIFGITVFLFLGIWFINIIRTWTKQKTILNIYFARVKVLKDLPPVLKAEAESLGLAGRITYIASDDFISFTYGFLSPWIVISDSLVELLDPDELRAVLLHEQCHMQKRDPLKLFVLRSLFGKALNLSPVTRLLSYFSVTMELQADRFALEGLGDLRLSLASALLKLVKGQQPLGVVGFATLLESRIEHCLNENWVPKPSLNLQHWVFLITYLFFLALILLITINNLFVSFSCHLIYI